MAGQGSGLGNILADVQLIILLCMILKSSVSFLDLYSQPLIPAQSFILSGTLDKLRVFTDFLTRKIQAIETNLKLKLDATLSDFTIGIPISSFAAPITNKPGVLLAEELQPFLKFIIIKIPCFPRHPVLISLRVYPFV